MINKRDIYNYMIGGGDEYSVNDYAVYACNQASNWIFSIIMHQTGCTRLSHVKVTRICHSSLVKSRDVHLTNSN